MSRQLTRAKKIKVASNSRLDFGLPHGPSFTFVTELIACDPGISAECATVFSGNDPIFAGHFPGNPLVPGVIITEALAQTAGIAAAAGHPEARPFFLLSAIRNMKFFDAVRPEQRIALLAEKIAEMGELLQFRVDAVVNGKCVSEGELVLTKTPLQPGTSSH
jgi:3-hydroxyacyl-[acyl-carrier-protein] dehydratase